MKTDLTFALKIMAVISAANTIILLIFFKIYFQHRALLSKLSHLPCKSQFSQLSRISHNRNKKSQTAVTFLYSADKQMPRKSERKMAMKPSKVTVKHCEKNIFDIYMQRMCFLHVLKGPLGEGILTDFNVCVEVVNEDGERNFKLLKLLGQGSQGFVFDAVCFEEKRKVVLKIEAYVNERELNLSLFKDDSNHFIVKLLNYYISSGNLILVMEPFDGTCLKEMETTDYSTASLIIQSLIINLRTNFRTID